MNDMETNNMTQWIIIGAAVIVLVVGGAWLVMRGRAAEPAMDSSVNATSTAPTSTSQMVVDATTNIPKGTMTAGIGFTASESANLAGVATTANHGIVEDLQAVQDVNDDFYGVIATSSVKAEILALAAYIETQQKIYSALSNDSDLITNVSTDVGSKLKTAGYNRTFLNYHSTLKPLDAGIVGEEFPKVPGSSTYKFKDAVGIPLDTFTSNVLNLLTGTPTVPGKNVNVIYGLAGKRVYAEGKMASGMFIDNQVGIDWTHARLQESIFGVLTDNDKVPYTDDGGAMIETAMRAVFDNGIKNGLIAAGSVVINIPKVANVPIADRANRLLSGITFSYRLAGAFHFIKIVGKVTV